MRRQLTERVLAGLKPPETGRLEVADTKCAGLLVRVTKKGTKTFSVIYRSPSTRRQVRYTLGRPCGVLVAFAPSPMGIPRGSGAPGSRARIPQVAHR